LFILCLLTHETPEWFDAKSGNHAVFDVTFSSDEPSLRLHLIMHGNRDRTAPFNQSELTNRQEPEPPVSGLAIRSSPPV